MGRLRIRKQNKTKKHETGIQGPTTQDGQGPAGETGRHRETLPTNSPREWSYPQCLDSVPRSSEKHPTTTTTKSKAPPRYAVQTKHKIFPFQTPVEQVGLMLNAQVYRCVADSPLARCGVPKGSTPGTFVSWAPWD